MRIRTPGGDRRGSSLSRTLWRNLDSLPSSQQIDRLIAREVARAERNGLHFSLVLFRVRRGGRVGVNERRLALTLLRRARLTDEVGWFGDEHLCALLPDTSAVGAQIFADSVSDLVGRKGPRPIATIYAFPHHWDKELPASSTPAVAPRNGTRSGDTRDNRGQRQDDSRDEDRNDSDDWNDSDGLREDAEVPELVTAGSGRLSFDVDGEFSPKSNGRKNGNANGHHKANGHAASVKPAPTQNKKAVVASSEHEVVPMHDLLIRPMPWWKRVIDIACAGFGLLMLSPLFAVVAILIKTTSPGPVIFKQRRAGLGGRPFTIWKFRTMCADAEKKKKALLAQNEQDGPAFKLTNDPRITTIGHILRKTSIDELPQLINVLKGDMSLVGPRPLPISESDECELWQRRRLDVTPGLTCIWQVEARGEVAFSDWVRMDVKYMRRRTVWHDLSILFRTVPAVLLRRGAR